MKALWTVYLLIFSLITFAQDNKSPEYPEVMRKYQAIDSMFEEGKMITYGKTDCGEALHLFVISQTRIFDPSRLHELKKCILFINNGIHPGEPDGIDASIKLATDLLTKPLYRRLLENTVVCIVPVFNIDGALERSCCSRVNQNGPEEYGFRGNAKNLDLNRDFMKADSKNTFSMMQMIRQWDPDVFIDTHVSDGADYQYSMTLISSQHNKMNSEMGKYMKDKLTPELMNKMKEKNDEMVSYVNLEGNNEIPDSGITAFLETPRYMCGYTSLFNTFSFIAESHMLKPFPRRVDATFNLLTSLIEVCDEQGKKILELRSLAEESDKKEKYFKFNWTLDTSKKELINFNGYAAEQKKSNVTGGMRLYYDKAKPYKKKIPFYDTYLPSDSVIIPRLFIIPQAFYSAIKLMEINNVKMIRVQDDSSTIANVTYIENYKTIKEPFEGHYFHYDVTTRNEEQKINIRKGDYLIYLPQKNFKYILEALIPGAVDSYFCSGYFDSILQQKEWFSSYVFEDLAEKLLQKDQTLKLKFEKWKSDHPEADEYSQLNFIYKSSDYFEKTYMRYPIYSIY